MSQTQPGILLQQPLRWLLLLFYTIPASLFDCFDSIFTEFISGSRIHYPDMVYHINANN